MTYTDSYNEWLKHVEDEELLHELGNMSDRDKAEAFSGELSFGTAGLRGVMGAGTARMNIYTVYRATEGLARYMAAHKMHSCAITYDSRINGKRFCELVAATLAQHGFRVYLTPECMPTPYLSFMVRELHCDVGVNVTASHNPSEYNGYKVYGADGCQLLDDDAEELTRYIDTVRLFTSPLPDFSQYEGDYIQYTDKLLEELYIDRVSQERLTLDELNIKVVYTPLNGAGYRVVPETLRRAGVDITTVAQQSMPDGNFPTCPYPNPEKADTLRLAKQIALKVGADVVIANDPDCDRLGAAAWDGNEYRQLTGNEVGVLLADCILNQMQLAKTLPRDPVLVKTIVSTPMVDAIAKHYGAEVRDVLTGFKYIGNVIGKLEKEGHADRYVFGFEESCGYLKGTYVRDKDGVVAALLLAECASLLKTSGKTLIGRLNELYDEFGRYFLNTLSYRFEGIAGTEDKEKLLRRLRKTPFSHLGDSLVTDVCDFLTQTRYDLPKSDVLRLRSADGSQLIVRPSGTEPLIKCYIAVSGKEQSNKQRFEAIKAQTDKFFIKQENK